MCFVFQFGRLVNLVSLKTFVWVFIVIAELCHPCRVLSALIKVYKCDLVLFTGGVYKNDVIPDKIPPLVKDNGIICDD